jgi:hypothetical protein
VQIASIPKAVRLCELRELKVQNAGTDSIRNVRSLFQRSRELPSISGIPKVHNYYSSSRSGLSHTGRSLPQLVVSFRQLPSAGQYELHAFALPALDDMAQRANQVLRITKSLAGEDK